MAFEKELAEGLAARKKQNRFRQRRVLNTAQQVSVTADQQPLINFCSNDYLGLANHPQLIAAASKATECYGLGGGASHLVCGHTDEHHLLEEELAGFTGRDRALLFSTGYMANLGVIQALVGRSDAVFEDKLNHASLLDGALLSRAKLIRYAHADTGSLDRQLKASSASRKLIVTDGVFSMDGDCAPLKELAKVAKENDSVLMVDDAHGFGCLGKRGGGLQELYELDQHELPILVGTLGKAFGSFGAFVAGSENLIETLIQFSRSYIYTTSMPPSIAAASRASLRIVVEETWRREKLNALISQFKSQCADNAIPRMLSDTAIQPILVGDDIRALNLSHLLHEQGFWVSAIRPPTVPEGQSRLRVTLSAEHTAEQVSQLVAALHAGLKSIGATPNMDGRLGSRDE